MGFFFLRLRANFIFMPPSYFLLKNLGTYHMPAMTLATRIKALLLASGDLQSRGGGVGGEGGAEDIGTKCHRGLRSRKGGTVTGVT